MAGAQFSPLAWEWEQEAGSRQARHLSGTLLQIIFPSTLQPASCETGIMTIITVINCTIGIIIAEGPSLGLLVFFLVCEVIISNTFEEKKKLSPYQQTEPELLLAAVRSQSEA